MTFLYVCDEEALWYSVNARKRSSAQIRCINAVYAKDESRKIKFQKYKDLQSFKPYIAPIYHPFYDTLLHDESQCNNDDIDIFEDELLDMSEDENNAKSPAGLPTSSLTMSATVSSISKQTSELKGIGRDLKKNRTYGKPARKPELDDVHHDRTRNVNFRMRLATVKHSNSSVHVVQVQHLLQLFTV